MAYKAKSVFSFGGRVYQEGQEIVETNEDTLEKLEKQGFISSGKGKSAAEVEQEASEAQAKKGEENAKKWQEASRAEEQRLIDAGKNSVNVATVDQTKSTATVKEKAELNDNGTKAAPKKGKK